MFTFQHEESNVERILNLSQIREWRLQIKLEKIIKCKVAYEL